MSPRSPVGGGGARHPRSLANLKRGGNPAPRGNGLAVRHGAYRAVLDGQELEAAERRILEALAADAPVREADGGLPAADMAAVRLLADALVRLDGVRDFLRRRGLEDEKGRLREGVLDLERRLRQEAADHAAGLGMTPRSRAALGLDLVRAARASLEDELADARAARLAREHGVIDGDGGAA